MTAPPARAEVGAVAPAGTLGGGRDGAVRARVTASSRVARTEIPGGGRDEALQRQYAASADDPAAFAAFCAGYLEVEP